MHPVQRHRPGYRRVETPADIESVLGLLAELGERARIVAGGTDLLLETARGGRAGVEALIDVSRLAGTREIEREADRIRIGATVTHNDIVTSDLIRTRALPLAQASWEIGSPQLRNRATVVGNVVTASPANDTITALRILDADVELRSLRGVRSVPLADFHTGLRSTVMAPDEMVTAIVIDQLGDHDRGVWIKLGNRRAQAISVVHLAARVRLDGRTVTDARLALGSVAATVVEGDVSGLIRGELGDEAIASVAEEVSAGLAPIDDVRATAAYRRDQIPRMIRLAFEALRADTPPTLPASPITLGRSERVTAVGNSHDAATRVTATVNGRPVGAPAGVPQTLLDWLRDGVGLTGTKEGCAEGECGACTVILDGDAVMSCLVPSTRADGASITTIEGLGPDGTLHPLQQAFIDATAVQCGFCIPGFLMAGAALLDEKDSPDGDDAVHAFAGNLCRCTGYHSILDAIARAAR